MSDTPIEDGQRIALILQDEVFQRTLQRLDSKYIKRWREAETPEDRERLHALQKALADLEKELGIVVGDGQIAEFRHTHAGQ